MIILSFVWSACTVTSALSRFLLHVQSDDLVTGVFVFICWALGSVLDLFLTSSLRVATTPTTPREKVSYGFSSTCLARILDELYFLFTSLPLLFPFFTFSVLPLSSWTGLLYMGFSSFWALSLNLGWIGLWCIFLIGHLIFFVSWVITLSWNLFSGLFGLL